jgi:hypothetical protein
MTEGDSAPFYMPDPGLFGHNDAWHLYTSFAAALEDAGLADRFPADPDIRKVAIELLAEREAVENVEADPSLIDDAAEEARIILRERRGNSGNA